MKKLIFLLLIVAGCQTAKIKKREYLVSESTVELASVGWAKSLYKLDNGFLIHGLPVFENKIRLDVSVMPFNAEMYKTYMQKSATDQSAAKITFNDSLPVKPEYVTVNIMDISAFATELNAPHNRNIFNYLKETEKSVLVTGIATVLPSSDIEKIKQADSYYLMNNPDKKYTVVLFKSGKKTDVIDLGSGITLAHVLSRFCWVLNDRQQWYISDIVQENQSCRGNTRSKVKEKEEKNLFKM